jgi:DNA-binding NarL/FixJ family response regulator
VRTYSTAVVIGGAELRRSVRAALLLHPVRILFEDEALDSIHLKRLDFDVLFIEAEPAGEPMEEVVARIGRVKPSALIVAVGDTARPEAALAALRAGAGEVIMPPFEGQVPAIMDRLAAKIANRVRA